MESETVEFTLEQMLEVAQTCHQAGNIAQAMQFYELVLEAIPEHPDALHFLGVLKHQVSDSEAGLQMVRKSIELVPDNASFHNNLGNILRELNRHEAAETSYRTALQIKPDDADALCNLAGSLHRLHKDDEAEKVFQQALEYDPEHGESFNNLGNLYREQKRFDDAVRCYEKAIKFEIYQPATGGSLGSLANVLRLTGRYEEAEKVLHLWRRKDPDNPTVAHLLSAFTGKDVPERASDAYVVQCFQAYADNFEESLARLEYRAPQLIGARIEQLLPGPDKQFAICDLGCGTGLVADFLKPYANKLVGIDLSVNMLQQAKKRDVYDNLYEVELGKFLTHTQAEFDVLVSVDTLCYLGDLRHVINEAYSALRARGWFCFTVELTRDPTVNNYALSGTGRYTHARPYLESLLHAAGFINISLDNVVLRKEADDPVKGLLIVAQGQA